MVPLDIPTPNQLNLANMLSNKVRHYIGRFLDMAERDSHTTTERLYVNKIDPISQGGLAPRDDISTITLDPHLRDTRLISN